MGINKRQYMREEQRRIAAGRTHQIIIKWELHIGDWLVNFLDPRSRLPLSRQRVYPNYEPIIGMVSRSITNVQGGPKGIIFRKGLDEGKGEIQIEISDEQMRKLKGPQKIPRVTW